mgnify:CR=1 FL=1
MSLQAPVLSRMAVSDSGKLCFGVAAGAFLTALVGIAVNTVFPGWMAAGGLALLGLFYLALGLAEIRFASATRNDDGRTKPTHHRSWQLPDGTSSTPTPHLKPKSPRQGVDAYAGIRESVLYAG